MLTRMSKGMSTHSVDAFAARLGRGMQALMGTERVLTVARHAVFAQAAQSSALRMDLHAARGRLAAWMSPLLADLGSHNPEDDQRYLLALVDGLLSSQLLDPTSEFKPAGAIAALLAGLSASPRMQTGGMPHA